MKHTSTLTLFFYGGKRIDKYTITSQIRRTISEKALIFHKLRRKGMDFGSNLKKVPRICSSILNWSHLQAMRHINFVTEKSNSTMIELNGTVQKNQTYLTR
ncbi:hypothetical protein LOAG_11477 [Loa loa]|uniref:Uncharacterized protein n=1 Tax=Loa loa TaxID=7209 RepID=A0A1S0TMW0_LOALO|nr:hypothetical protein LOAG_11477 [Loa loa]EFO17024.1 hypothetical protein LOAG_11477 [Loa loa]